MKNTLDSKKRPSRIGVTVNVLDPLSLMTSAGTISSGGKTSVVDPGGGLTILLSSSASPPLPSL